MDQMIAHAKREAPYECCGILAGVEFIFKKKNEIENLPSDDIRISELDIPEDRTVRYMMDPKEQMQAMRNIRERGLTMMGIYHSHPHSQAIPSKTDIRLAFYPDVFYLIVSLAQETPDLRAYSIINGKTDEEGIAPC